MIIGVDDASLVLIAHDSSGPDLAILVVLTEIDRLPYELRDKFNRNKLVS